MPTIKKFSSPYWPLGSRMSLDSGSSALMVLSRLFFDVLHCHAPPVRTSASTANSAASERLASRIGLRRTAFRRRVSAVGVGGSASALPGVTRSVLRRPGRLRLVAVRVVGDLEVGNLRERRRASRPGYR